MENEFDDDIPVPPGTRGKGRTDKLLRMEVGQSFFSTDLTKNGRVSAFSSLARGRKFQNKAHRFLFRKVTENGVVGFRIWRIA